MHLPLRKSNRLIIFSQAHILTPFVLARSLPILHWECLSLQLSPLLPRDRKAVITSMLIIANLAQLPSDLSNHFNILKNKKTKHPWLQRKRKRKISVDQTWKRLSNISMQQVITLFFPPSVMKRKKLLSSHYCPLDYGETEASTFYPIHLPAFPACPTRLLPNIFPPWTSTLT